MEGIGAILPIGIGAAPCSVQKLFCCEKACRQVNRRAIVKSVSLFIKWEGLSLGSYQN
jgi:hypothetical protein